MILGVKVVEFSILQLQETTISSKNIQFTYKYTSIQIKPIQTLSTSTCALSLGASHLDRLLWTESIGSKEIIPGFMWNPIASSASMEVSKVCSRPTYLL